MEKSPPSITSVSGFFAFCSWIKVLILANPPTSFSASSTIVVNVLRWECVSCVNTISTCFAESAVSAETVCVPAKVVRHNMPVSANAAQFFLIFFSPLLFPEKYTVSHRLIFSSKNKEQNYFKYDRSSALFVFTILHKFYIDVKKSCHFYICFFCAFFSAFARSFASFFFVGLNNRKIL